MLHDHRYSTHTATRFHTSRTPDRGKKKSKKRDRQGQDTHWNRAVPRPPASCETSRGSRRSSSRACPCRQASHRADDTLTGTLSPPRRPDDNCLFSHWPFVRAAPRVPLEIPFCTRVTRAAAPAPSHSVQRRQTKRSKVGFNLQRERERKRGLG